MAYKNGSRLRGGHCYRQNIEVKRFIRERDNYTCQICGEEGWIVDHIIPYAISHDSTIANLQVLCHACNLKKRRERKDKSLSLAQWEQYLKTELAKGGV